MSVTFHDALGAPVGHRVRFPAGESHIANPNDRTEFALVRYDDDSDLMTLAMWASARKAMGQQAKVMMPYLPGARQDRGIPLGAKVYADFINSMELDRIVCFDPHSDVMSALLNNLRIVPITVFQEPGDGLYIFDDEYVGVIAPDIGARKRAELVAGSLGVPVYQATKHRDFKTGTLSGFSIEELPEGQLLVVDDICDGGGTFIGLASQFPPGCKPDLWVSHGVFSKGRSHLTPFYRNILTTDSVPGSSQIPMRCSLFSHLKKELYP